MNIVFTGTKRTMLIAGSLIMTALGGGITYDGTNSLTTRSGSIKNDGSTGVNDGSIVSTVANLSFFSGGIYEHALNGGTIPATTWDAASTCLITGITSTVPTVESFAPSFGNFTWNCTSQNADLTLAGYLNIVNATLKF